MPTVKMVEYEDANDEVRAVYDDIKATRNTDYINNFDVDGYNNVFGVYFPE